MKSFVSRQKPMRGRHLKQRERDKEIHCTAPTLLSHIRSLFSNLFLPFTIPDATRRRPPLQKKTTVPTFGTGKDQLWIDFKGSLHVFMNYRGAHITPRRRGKSQHMFGKGTEFNKRCREEAACMWILVQH